MPVAKTTRLSLVGMTVVLLAALPARGDGPRGKITKAGKAATALVKGKVRGAQGTAFCIHPDGIFLTNEHVISDESEISIVLDPGTSRAKVLPARVLRSDKALDLALLQVEGEKDLPVLPLATKNELSETDEIIAFGFPFGQRLAADPKDLPAISVNVGKVTSLREKGGELHRIQIDAVLNPGNSGGPILDGGGKVVGVVVSGVRGAGVNFAIPINHVLRFLDRPEILFEPPALKLAKVHDEAEFRARALVLTPGGKPPELELTLTTPDRARRQFKMVPARGSYRARAVPIPRAKGPAVFRLEARYPRGLVRAEVEDGSFKVGTTAVKFSEVRRIAVGPESRVWLRSGKLLRGPLSGADAVRVRLGSTTLPLDLEKAAEVRLRLPGGLDSVTALVVAKQDGKEVGRLTRPLAVAGASRAGEADIFLDLDVAPLEKDVVVRKLEAPVADVAVGGGGRYLILHLPKLSKLAVFDANKAKVVKLLPAPDAGLKFTAGLDRLLIALPASRTIQRWNLETLELEQTVPYPTKGEVLALSLGAASSGPALVIAKEPKSFQPSAFLLGLEKLDKKVFVWVGNAHHQLGARQQLHMRTSYDGKGTGLWAWGTFPTGVFWIRWDNLFARADYTHSSNGHVIPGPGGKVLFTGLGMYTSVGFVPGQNKPYPGSDPNGRYVPAHHSDYYLYLGAAPTFTNKNPPRAFSIHKLGVAKPVLSLDGIEVPHTDEQMIKDDFTLDKRFHLIPQAKLLIEIPTSNDRLVLRRVDLEAAQKKAGGGEK